MNRFSVLIALVAFVGLAGANFHHKGGLKHHGLRHHLHPEHFHEGEDFGDVDVSHHGGRFQDEEEFGLGLGHGHGHGHGHRHGHGHGHSHALRHGADFEGGFNGHNNLGHRQGDRFGGVPHFGGHKQAGKHSHGGKLRRGGVHSGGLNRHSGIGSGFEQGSLGGGSNRLGGHRRQHGGSSGGLGGAGGAGAGVIGAHRGQKEFEAGLGGSNHGESNFGVEGHQGASISGEGHFNNAHNRGDHDDIEGVRKHQVINKEKTIVKDKTNGVNDVDGFRHSTGNHDDRHSELGASGSASESSGASLNRQNEFDNEFGAGVGGESSSETVGAAGIGAAGAAGAN